MRLRPALALALVLGSSLAPGFWPGPPVMCGLVDTNEAHAQVDDDDGDRLPSGRLGVRAGVRGGTGLYDFGFGVTGAVVAGYHPTSRDQRVSFGLEWATAWSFFEFADTASITGTVRLVEFEFGVRMRLRPGRNQMRFLVLGTGVSLTRASVPIPPDSERSYIGPYLAVSLEPKVGKMTLSFDVRYSMLAFGPQTITLGMTVLVGR